MVRDPEKIKKRDMRNTQQKNESDITGGVDIEEDKSQRLFTIRGFTTEDLNAGLDGSVVESNKHHRRIESYKDVELDNGLELRLGNSEAF